MQLTADWLRRRVDELGPRDSVQALLNLMVPAIVADLDIVQAALFEAQPIVLDRNQELDDSDGSSHVVAFGVLGLAPERIETNSVVPALFGDLLEPSPVTNAIFGRKRYVPQCPSILLKVRRDHYDDLLTTHHGSRVLLSLKRGEIARRNGFRILQSLSVKLEKVAMFLYLLATYSGVRISGTIRLPYDQATLARLTGFGRQYLSRFLKELQGMGLIRKGYGEIEIVDEAGLIAVQKIHPADHVSIIAINDFPDASMFFASPLG